MEKKLITINIPDGKTGKIVEKKGVLVNIVKEENPWSTITLEDGTKIRFRNPVINVLRIEGEKSSTGEPIYFMKQGSLMDVEQP